MNDPGYLMQQAEQIEFEKRHIRPSARIVGNQARKSALAQISKKRLVIKERNASTRPSKPRPFRENPVIAVQKKIFKPRKRNVKLRTLDYAAPYDHDKSHDNDSDSDGDLSKLRFGFSGRTISVDESRNIEGGEGLHHHGGAVHRAGYTIHEVLDLLRSTQQEQREFACSIVINIVDKQNERMDVQKAVLENFPRVFKVLYPKFITCTLERYMCMLLSRLFPPKNQFIDYILGCLLFSLQDDFFPYFGPKKHQKLFPDDVEEKHILSLILDSGFHSTLVDPLNVKLYAHFLSGCLLVCEEIAARAIPQLRMMFTKLGDEVDDLSALACLVRCPSILPKAYLVRANEIVEADHGEEAVDVDQIFVPNIPYSLLPLRFVGARNVAQVRWMKRSGADYHKEAISFFTAQPVFLPHSGLSFVDPTRLSDHEMARLIARVNPGIGFMRSLLKEVYNIELEPEIYVFSDFEVTKYPGMILFVLHGALRHLIFEFDEEMLCNLADTAVLQPGVCWLLEELKGTAERIKQAEEGTLDAWMRFMQRGDHFGVEISTKNCRFVLKSLGFKAERRFREVLGANIDRIVS
ncbi:hypothetical protein PCE1_000540 [Barthelona sp. PCE]